MFARSVLAALALCIAAGPAAAAPARAAIAWAPCAPAGSQCARLAVPLDPSGAVAGTVTLSLARRPAPVNPTASAVIGLAGGPGQAALPFVAKLARNIAPALATRDLVVFDQRGTGRSDALRCRALRNSTFGRGGPRACARQIGPARAFYRTAETVEDIEAIRREGGYARLVLYGTSYGTKVATAYAARYPDRVEALVLDSVVLPEGPDVFNQSSLRAVVPALRDLCGAGRCRGITAHPGVDLARLVRRAERRPLRGAVTTPRGATEPRRVDAVDLFDIVAAGDFDPTLRADLPGAVRAALRGDARPILRLSARADDTAVDPSIDEVLFVTTICEEAPFPWPRRAGASARLRAALGAASAIPRGRLGPFDRFVALFTSLAPVCARWPTASGAPPPPGPLPAVPTLIVSGAADVRTPPEDARALAARSAAARLVTVPFVGHSTIGADRSGCARAAVAAFFAGQPIAPCTATAPRFAPTPVAPARLARVPGAGRAPKTIAAVGATIRDVRRQLTGRALARGRDLRVGDRVGGLRSGTARWTAAGIVLRRVEYVPGVVVSGRVPRAPGRPAALSVGGAAAARGSVRVLPGGRVVARLDGRRVVARLVGILPAAPDGAPETLGFRAVGPVVGQR